MLLSVKKNCVHQRGPIREKIDEKGKKILYEQYVNSISVFSVRRPPKRTKIESTSAVAVVQYTRDTCQYGSFSLAPALPRDHPARAIKNSRGFRMEGYLDSPALWRYRARKREPSLWPRTLFIWPLLSQNLSLSAHWLIVSSTPSNSPCTFLPSCSFERGYNI